MAKKSRRAKRKPTAKALKAYGNLLERGYNRFHPGGKAHHALKVHRPTFIKQKEG